MTKLQDTPVPSDRQSRAPTARLPFKPMSPGFTPEIRVYATSPEDLVFVLREWAKDLGYRVADGHPPFDVEAGTHTVAHFGRTLGTVVWRAVPGCDVPEWLAEEFAAEA